MKPIRKLTVLCYCFFACNFFAVAQEKYSKVKISVSSEIQRKLAFDELELDHFTTEGNYIIAELSQSQIEKLKKTTLSFKVVVDDMVTYTTELNRKQSAVKDINNRASLQMTGKQVANIITTPAAFTAGTLTLGSASGYGYYTYAEMVTKMQNLVAAYPGIVSLQTIGTSYNGQTIYGIKISDNVTVDEAEPEVLYTALQHAREAIGGTSMIFFAQYLAENYAANAEIKGLVDNREIFIIPCVNPDGYLYNYTGSNPATGGGLWRKNRKPNGDGTFGVDLNRNYGVDWSNCSGASASCGSSTTSSDTYWGTAAFSEPETQAVRDFSYAHNFVAAIDQHCYGPYFSLPFGRPTLHTLSASDVSFYSYVPALMGLYNCHRAGNSPETVAYEVAGGIKDWLLLGDIGVGTKQKVYGMTGEAGGGAFWAPVTQIPQLCKELCFQNIQLAFAAGSYFDLQDNSDIALTSLTGNLSYSLRSIGLGTSNSVTVSVVPIENIQSVGSSVTTTIGTYYGTFSNNISYTLPGSLANGKRIKFAWKVESDGVVVYDTITKFYNPVSLLYDNMEGSLATNWTVPGGGASTKWGFTSSSSYAGTQSLTESTAGNYGSSNSRTVTYNSTFNLSDATSSWLSFWVKHRAENCRDKLQIQVSTNNSTWVPLSGKNTVAEPNTTNGGTLGGQPALTGIRENWTRELYDLSAYNGAATLYLRLQFTSDGDASNFAYELDDGFYVDEIKVIKSTAPLTTLPVEFVNFYGKLTNENKVQLDWEAYVDKEHDYFIIEKSSNSTTFKSIGSYKGNPPYRFLDNSPENGNNFYRIKQVDKDGHTAYSKLINIPYLNKTGFIIYPNPVADVLQVKINGTTNDQYLIRITDAEGRVVKEQFTQPGTGAVYVNVKVQSLPSQLYIIRILNNKNETIGIQRFIKQ